MRIFPLVVSMSKPHWIIAQVTSAPLCLQDKLMLRDHMLLHLKYYLVLHNEKHQLYEFLFLFYFLVAEQKILHHQNPLLLLDQ